MTTLAPQPLVPKPAETNLRQIRRANGWTLDDLAKASSVNRGYLNRIERGIEKPSTKALGRIAEALQAAPEVYLEEPRFLLAAPEPI